MGFQPTGEGKVREPFATCTLQIAERRRLPPAPSQHRSSSHPSAPGPCRSVGGRRNAVPRMQHGATRYGRSVGRPRGGQPRAHCRLPALSDGGQRYRRAQGAVRRHRRSEVRRPQQLHGDDAPAIAAVRMPDERQIGPKLMCATFGQDAVRLPPPSTADARCARPDSRP